MENKKLFITDTILRDAHQSQAATRMRLEDMLPACEMLDEMGYWSLECWGGATFDVCMRFLGEDPWKRLDELKKHMPKTKLQMLLRGQNILGYKHYADDVVEAFVGKSIEHGINVIRIFDALNDTRNMEAAMKYTKKHGGICEAAISFTKSPVHDEAYFVNLAKELVQMGADTIAIKDMANLLLPYDAYSLVKKLKAEIDIPIHLHTHNTTGTGDMVNLMAAQAGVDIVDCALSPLANGTAQPATEALVATLKGTERDTGLDLGKLSECAAHFRKVQTKMKEEGTLDPKVLNVDTNTLLYQVPGGMLSNLISQLKGFKAEDKYKSFTKESKGLLRGEYGRLPGVVNEEVRKMAIGDDEVITCRPADLLEPELEKYREETRDFAKSEEDVLSYALFPQVAAKFFAERDGKAEAPKAEAPKAEAKKPETTGEIKTIIVEDLGN